MSSNAEAPNHTPRPLTPLKLSTYSFLPSKTDTFSSSSYFQDELYEGKFELIDNLPALEPPPESFRTFCVEPGTTGNDTGVVQLLKHLEGYSECAKLNLVFVPKGEDPVPSFDVSGFKPDIRIYLGEEEKGWVPMAGVVEWMYPQLPATDDPASIPKEGVHQSFLYCALLSHHQPHIYQTYTLLAACNGYRICSQTISGREMTKFKPWEDDSDLCTFLHIIAKHRAKDKNLVPVRLLPDDDSVMSHIFNLRCKTNTLHVVPVAMGFSFRKSFIGAATICASGAPGSDAIPRFILKIQTKDEKRSTDERAILRLLQEIPGVVRLHELEFDNEVLPGGHIRSVLALRTVGLPLTSCSSFRQFFEVVFDLIETHRLMLRDTNVLHRDPSWGNVLIPIDEEDEASMITKNHEGSWFVDNLWVKDNSKPRYARGLWTDFDYAFVTDKARLVSTEKQAVGTKMFMARDILFPHGREADAIITMNTLGEREVNSRLDAAVAFGERVTDIQATFCETLNESAANHTASKVEFDRLADRRKILAAEQSPIHQYGGSDIESLFWIVILFVLRARREPQIPVNDGPSADALFQTLQDRDRQNAFAATVGWVSFTKATAGWASYTKSTDDSPFRDVLEMLEKLAYYFVMPWYAKEDLDPFHAHNLFQALLVPVLNRLRKTDITVKKYQTVPITGLQAPESASKGPFSNSTGRLAAAEDAYRTTSKRNFDDMRENDLKRYSGSMQSLSSIKEEPQVASISAPKSRRSVQPCLCSVDCSLRTLVQANTKYLVPCDE